MMRRAQNAHDEGIVSRHRRTKNSSRFPPAFHDALFSSAISTTFRSPSCRTARWCITARLWDEPEAASMKKLVRKILVQSPHRFWLRFQPRG
jgi:hypothetical protein